jgi:plasmid stabilization system protein ParE
MALSIKWSKYADRKFDKILEYLIATWGENTTKAFVNRTYEYINLLSKYPEIGTLENPEKNIRGLVIVKQITVFYKVKKNNIVILNFYDNRQKPSSWSV